MGRLLLARLVAHPEEKKSGAYHVEEMDMRSAKLVAGLMLASCLVTAPASAAGLLGGVLGGGSSTGGSLGSTVSHVVSGLTGGSSGSAASTVSSSSVGVSGVATASVSNSSSGTRGNVTALGGGGSTVNVGLHSILGGNSNLGVTLPGSGGSSGTLVGGLANTVNGITGNGATLDTTLNNTGLSGNQGGLGSLLGGNGGLLGYNGGGDPNSPTGPTGPTGPGRTGGLGGPGGAGGPGVSSWFPELARLGAACRNVDIRGIAALMQSGHYNRYTLFRWRHASNVQVVPIRTCAALRRDIRIAAARNGNVQMVQQLAAADPLVSASLGRTRYGAGNVLGVGQANGMLTVYVY